MPYQELALDNIGLKYCRFVADFIGYLMIFLTCKRNAKFFHVGSVDFILASIIVVSLLVSYVVLTFCFLDLS
jgi:hypothetical protein